MDFEILGPMTHEEAEDYLGQRAHIEYEVGLLKAQLEEKLKPMRSALNLLNERNQNRLEAFVREQAEHNGKKTFPFWHGTARLTKCGGKPVLVNEDAAKDYLLTNDLDHLLTPMQIRKGEYQKYANDLLKDQGEIAPGCEIEPERDSFSVSFKAQFSEGGAIREEDDA